MTPDIGELLAEARRARGLTVKDVELALKIRAKHVQALERGEASTIQGEAYAIAFLRSYATYLELDADELVKRYREQQHPAPPASPPEPRWRSNVKLLFIVGLVVLLAVLVGRTLTSAPPAKPAVRQPAKPPVKRRPPVKAEPAQQAPSGMVLSLEAQAEGGAWVRVTVDGKLDFEGILPANQPRQWRASDSVLVRTGKPAQVIVRKNGEMLGPVGGIEKLYKAKE